MARPNPDDYTKNELANRCYEFIDLVENVGTVFETWTQVMDPDRLASLNAVELDDRIQKLKDAFSALAAEKTDWMPGEKLAIPLHPRHEMKDQGRALITVTIECLKSGEEEQFVATVPRQNRRGQDIQPLVFTIE